MSTFFEDKKCRLCGHADVENENIFSTRDRFLVKKIAAVFSIWVTPTDPLPKCICAKCILKVTSTYKSYSQVKKLQTKWLENVATQEPNNNYIQVLNFMERANMSIKNFIETNYREKLCKDVIENLLISALSGMHENTTEAEKPNPNEQSNNSNANLVSNGTMDINESSSVKAEVTASDADDEEENLSLAKIVTNKKIKLTPTPQESAVVKCKYCALKFESLKELAVHQISHMKLSMPKLFQPKCLDKNFRRGRLISVQSRQSLRCLNCYLVFDDNKCILEHWSKAECDFYCQICGEEFAQSPKMLREHVSEVHGISYRSLKMQRDLSFLSTTSMQPHTLGKSKQKIETKSNKQKTLLPKTDVNPHPTNMEVSSSTTPLQHSSERRIKCRICNRDFRNFKACNSHMRAHKPPYSYNDNDQLPDLNTDAYMEPEPMNCEITPPPQTSMPPTNLPQVCTSTAPTSSQNVIYKDDNIRTTSPAANTSASNSNLNFENTLSKKNYTTELLDTELETKQVNSNTINNNQSINNHKKPDVPSSNVMVNQPPSSSSPNTSKTPSTTAPRGIRMKFVNRRSDLNGANSAIKVKSINDLKTTQNIPTPSPQNISSSELKSTLNAPTCPPHHISPNEARPILNVSTCSPQHVSPNELKSILSEPTCPPQQTLFNKLIPNQNTIQCLPPPYAAFGNSAQNIPTRPSLIHHTSVIVNSLQNQPIPTFNSFEPPITHNTVMPSTIKNEPMEFI